MLFDLCRLCQFLNELHQLQTGTLSAAPPFPPPTPDRRRRAAPAPQAAAAAGALVSVAVSALLVVLRVS
jgi:hypothetical protein